MRTRAGHDEMMDSLTFKGMVQKIIEDKTGTRSNASKYR